MHWFPNPDKFPDRFKTWVGIVGGKLGTPADYQYYKNKRICDVHFVERYKNRNNRLNALAVPTLHLSGKFYNNSSIMMCNWYYYTVSVHTSTKSFRDKLIMYIFFVYFY